MKLLRFYGWMGENNKGILLRKVLKNRFSDYPQILVIIHGLSAHFQHFEGVTPYPFSNTMLELGEFMKNPIILLNVVIFVK